MQLLYYLFAQNLWNVQYQCVCVGGGGLQDPYPNIDTTILRLIKSLIRLYILYFHKHILYIFNDPWATYLNSCYISLFRD